MASGGATAGGGGGEDSGPAVPPPSHGGSAGTARGPGAALGGPRGRRGHGAGWRPRGLRRRRCAERASEIPAEKRGREMAAGERRGDLGARCRRGSHALRRWERRGAGTGGSSGAAGPARGRRRHRGAVTQGPTREGRSGAERCGRVGREEGPEPGPRIRRGGEAEGPTGPGSALTATTAAALRGAVAAAQRQRARHAQCVTAPTRMRLPPRPASSAALAAVANGNAERRGGNIRQGFARPLLPAPLSHWTAVLPMGRSQAEGRGNTDGHAPSRWLRPHRGHPDRCGGRGLTEGRGCPRGGGA